MKLHGGENEETVYGMAVYLKNGELKPLKKEVLKKFITDQKFRNESLRSGTVEIIFPLYDVYIKKEDYEKWMAERKK